MATSEIARAFLKRAFSGQVTSGDNVGGETEVQTHYDSAAVTTLDKDPVLRGGYLSRGYERRGRDYRRSQQAAPNVPVADARPEQLNAAVV